MSPRTNTPTIISNSSELRANKRLWRSRWNDEREIDAELFDGFGNGSLHLYVVSDPDWEPYQVGDARYLDLDFHFRDWEALFANALKTPEVDRYVQGDDIEELRERNRKKFRQSIAEFPMLSRIFDMYEDYLFDPDEIISLREECLKLKSRLTEKNAVKALRKLIYACDEASKAASNLMFVCD